MKFFAYFKKLNKLGASMVEYAIVLAFISSIGASFSDNLTSVIQKPFNTVASILGLASNGSDTLSSVQKLAYSLFTDEKKITEDKNNNNRFNSFYKEFVSGANGFIEKHLQDAGIDTAWKSNTINYDEKNNAVFQSLWTDGIIPSNVKSFTLITIADDMNIAPTKGDQFSATQYLLYKSGNTVQLAATRSFDSVTVTKDPNHSTIIDKNNSNWSHTNKYDINEIKTTDTNTHVYYIDSTNHGFVAYKPN